MEAKLVKAKYKYNNTSARKMRLIADLIRGKDVLTAMDILTFTNKAAASDMTKVLNSVISNAVHNNGWKKENLLVFKVHVDDAPTFKRGRAAARGRYHKILKRNCHIEIYLKQIDEEIKIEKDKISKAGTKIKKVNKKDKLSNLEKI